MNHWKLIADGNVNFLGVGAKADSGGVKDGANIVRLLSAILGVPDSLVLVRKGGSTERRPVVATHADDHEPEIICRWRETIEKSIHIPSL